ncbi:hypothetical protein BV25DRAFT_1921583 [Artomyces pyxidatus]|uniref:Uncharacterized protein n=1 Tax=Artomyces pyxidatus TaxID=48021 RepID=A0ACB8SIN1_9AGAM|nr:hypothetical protein BV25DRAFT_1921583 [Artomyces pyxidatus]
MAAVERSLLQLALLLQAPIQEITPSQLTQEIDKVQRYLASLRRLKNSRTPVARIPVEIFCQILSFIKCDPRWPHRNPERPPAWVAVTHVCQFWREVALSSPLLWSNIVTYNLPWMEETLVRSKAVPVSLVMYVNRNPWEFPNSLSSVITRIVPHIARAKEIIIHGENVASYIQPLFKYAAPWLEVLELSDIESHLNIRDATLFPGQEPLNLRTLRLKRCSFVWPIPVLFSPTITELKISHMSQEDRPSLLQIRAVLSAMPNLKTLVLSDVLRKSPDSTAFVVDPASCTVPLPFLQSLSFATEKAVDVLIFISQLSVPSDASLHILCKTLEGFSVDEHHDSPSVFHSTLNPGNTPASSTSGLSYLMLALVKSLPPTVPETERDVTGGYRSIGIVELNEIAYPRPKWCLLAGIHPRQYSYYSQDRHAIAGMLDNDMPVWNTRRFLGLPWQDAPEREQHITSILLNACLLLPLSEVDTVIINCDLYRDPALWWHTFGRLRHVKAVVVSGHAVSGFAAALCGKGRRQSLPEYSILGNAVRADCCDQITDGHLFPELRHLKLENAYLGWEGIMDDLTEGLGCLQRDGQGQREPLFSLSISSPSHSRQEDDRRYSLYRLTVRPTDQTGGEEPEVPQWFRNKWATAKLNDYFW